MTYCQDRGMDDPEQPLTLALSPSEGAREQPPQVWAAGREVRAD